MERHAAGEGAGWGCSPPSGGGVSGAPPPKFFENLHAFWPILAYYRPHFLCPDICNFLLPSMVSMVKSSAGKTLSLKKSLIRGMAEFENEQVQFNP